MDVVAVVSVSLFDASGDDASTGGEACAKMASRSLLSVGRTRSWPINVERYCDDLYAVY